MIRSYKDKETEKVGDRVFSKKFQAIAKQAAARLAYLKAASALIDLSVPGYRLEKLSGNRDGQYSIRINDQYRICFEWRENGAHNVEITDYH